MILKFLVFFALISNVCARNPIHSSGIPISDVVVGEHYISTQPAFSPNPTLSSSVTEVATTTPAPKTSSSSNTVEILVPTPTSSWDGPREEDRQMTINDKYALGFGIPVILIVLSTLGYWRATKYFLHRKITGEAKLPLYGAYGDSGSSSNPNLQAGSRSPSLWGAASSRGSIVPPTAQGESSNSTELMTAPKIVYTNADARIGSNLLHVPSTSRQEWRGT